MNDVPASLVVVQGPEPDKEYLLRQATTIIGRAATNDIAIADPEVSRQHVQITLQGNEFRIEDLGSTNGTFVNNQRIREVTLLYNGDIIELGASVRLSFSIFETGNYATHLEPDYGTPAETVITETFTSTPAIEAPVPAVPDAVEVGDAIDALPQPISSRRRWIFGCGCGCLFLIFLCAATIFFLDAYEQGRLLYCGFLQPFFELILGPFGFSPACALP